MMNLQSFYVKFKSELKQKKNQTIFELYFAYKKRMSSTKKKVIKKNLIRKLCSMLKKTNI